MAISSDTTSTDYTAPSPGDSDHSPMSGSFFSSMTTVTKCVLLFLLANLAMASWALLSTGSNSASSQFAALTEHTSLVDHSISLHDTRPNLDLDRLYQLGIESPELIRSIPIRDIQVGMRVPAHNPQLTDPERAEFELDIDPATWRTFTLEVDKLDGFGTVTVTEGSSSAGAGIAGAWFVLTATGVVIYIGREGHLSFASDLEIVEQTSRFDFDGKTKVRDAAPSILDRLGTPAEL